MFPAPLVALRSYYNAPLVAHMLSITQLMLSVCLLVLGSTRHA